MNGYIFFCNGVRLSQYKFWGDGENSGWIWTEQEKDVILKESVNWEFPPTHYQKAILLGPTVTLMGEKIKI